MMAGLTSLGGYIKFDGIIATPLSLLPNEFFLNGNLPIFIIVENHYPRLKGMKCDELWKNKFKHGIMN